MFCDLKYLQNNFVCFDIVVFSSMYGIVSKMHSKVSLEIITNIYMGYMYTVYSCLSIKMYWNWIGPTVLYNIETIKSLQICAVFV